MAVGHLLAARLGVEIGDDRLHGDPETMPRQFLRRAPERAVERVHEQPPHRVQDQRAAAIAPSTTTLPAPGVPVGKLSGRITRVVSPR